MPSPDRTGAPAHPELLAMLLADPRLPVGGYTQSGQLEGAVMAGVVGPADVPAFLQTRLLGVVRVEAGTAVVARHAVVGTASLGDVEAAWAARTVSPAVRAASRTQGRTLLRLASRLWPGAVVPLEPIAAPSRAVVLGTVAAGLGIDPTTLARLVAYDDVQTVCAAALKLLPLDPVAVAGWVVAALPAVEQVAAECTALEEPAEIPAGAAPQIEAWAQAHARSTRRLFRA